MTRYTMPARSQGRAFTHRALAKMYCDGVHTWVFVYGMTPDVEFSVRKWLSQRLDGFYCDLQAVYTPNYGSSTRTHIAMQFPPLPMSVGVRDEIVSVNAYGLSSTETARAVIKATGLNPHLSVCGWPFCLSELDWNENEEGAI